MLASSGNQINLMPDHTFFLQLAIFFAAVLILNNLVFRPMLELFKMRRRLTSEVEQAARDAEANANKLENEANQKLAEVLRQQMLERERKLAEARQQAEELTARAKEEAKNISKKARQGALASQQKAREGLSLEAKKLAEEIRSKVLS